jgi:N-acetylglucosaminyldiphosphoundecaprenol N-acetyl-beta-D-mannosaminyltransferase
VTGFLFFNFYPAKIFMGDCGSMFLGFMIGAGSLVCQTKTTTMLGLAIPFLVMGVPILDAGLVMVGRRVLERRSVFSADRGHLHHRLMDLGLRHRAVVMIIYAVTALCACIGVLMVTGDGSHSVELLAGGLLFLITVFACLHGGRFSRIMEALKRNWAIACQARTEKRSFEEAELRMRESVSFRTWWETLCDMGREMRFESIGLWDCRNGGHESVREWRASQQRFPAGRSVKLSLPISANGEQEWEVKASIWADGYLEVGGRQGMLLSRLMDEFPPPDHRAEAGTSDRRAETPSQSKPADRTASSDVAEAGRDVTNRRVRIPAPLDIMGVPVVPFESYDQALGCAEDIIESGRKSFWVAVNPIKIHNAWQKPALLSLLRQTDVAICDGVGVSITSRLLHGQSIKRCTGCDLFFKLLARAAQKSWGVYLLGASPQSNDAARSRLRRMHPGLRIVGWQDGYFEDSRAVIEQINASGADMLFVAMGSPKQEYWIARHRQAINASICLGVGGSFDIASGGLKRAPKIFQATGTEFLFRLMAEPRKRWANQKVLISYFIAVIGKKLVDFIMLNEEHEALVKYRRS